MTPLISIIIPAYNAEKYLAETLDSLRAQTVDKWECIIVDDGSTDKTAEVARGFCENDKRFKLHQQSNTGISGARNNGFAQTSPSSPFITFMDSDDTSLPHALATFASILEQQPQVVAAHGLAEMMDAESRPLEPGNFPSFQRARTGFDGSEIVPWGTDRPATFETLVHHSRIFPPGLIVIRRSTLALVGLFDSAMSPVEDWDMLIRLSRTGPIAFINDILLFYRRHAAQLTTASLNRIRHATNRVKHKTIASSENTPEQLQIIHGAHRAWQRMKIREKRAALKSSLTKGKLLTSAKLLAHITGHAMILLKSRDTTAPRSQCAR